MDVLAVVGDHAYHVRYDDYVRILATPDLRGSV